MCRGPRCHGTIIAADAANGRVDLFWVNEPDVPIHIIKVDDDGNGAINLATDPRVPGVGFDLFLNGSTVPDGTVVTTHAGIEPFTTTFDALGAGPIGATFIVCETVPAGWTFELVVPFAAAGDPAGSGRPCTSGTIIAADAANGRVDLFWVNEPDVPIRIIKLADLDTDNVANVAADERLAGVDFDLYFGVATTPLASITTSHTGIQPTSVFDVIGKGTAGTTITICENLPNGFAAASLSLPVAPDPTGGSRPCGSSTVTAAQVTAGWIEVIVLNTPNPPTPPGFVDSAST